MTPFSGMSGLTKNPLGILAIFLGVLYGIAGLLLGLDSRPLSDSNQTILTILILVFPFVTLGVFGWLVSRHHHKLYAPSDFRSDSGFLVSAKSASPEEVNKKVSLEANIIEQGDEVSGVGTVGSGDQSASTSSSSSLSSSQRRDLIKRAEEFAISSLASEFDNVKRHVKFRSSTDRTIIIDALARREDKFTLIEVLVMRNRSTFENRIRDLALNITLIDPPLKESARTDILVLIVWLEKIPMGAEGALLRAKAIFRHAGIDRVHLKQFIAHEDGSVAPVLAD